ncbi:AraC-like DNA-binding protein/mannose-6-phosphate isomerase-like protein (cupin superfamily) [Haloferula luteola]|uniref:AraC-like DNA-binding protein/mannose-6-phosphate isomerase-like protein (Cupin superfamily) n=1 Tax=Haloferula luteola TaxID=595692 RepID=A0A840VAZ0_9BACT|nr:helix-turn-helix domain-containing protein [Haloferula luteola]MBB5350969.1 AraC-like DNA-binding protein/mannose-6-phosphate isomerase-like protein (cupin superfamily) [Haloferula luteola]
MAVLARGEDYFGKEGFPVAVRRVRTEPDGGPSHLHDVTEVDHFHDFCELVLVLSGRGRHVLEGQSFPVSAGNVLVVQGSQVHAFRERDGLVLVNVMYDPERLPLPEGLLRRLPGYSALFKLEPSFRTAHRFSSRLDLGREDLGVAEVLAERLAKEEQGKDPGHEALRLGLLVELMGFLSRRYGESEAGESRALLRMGRLISTLEQQYAEPWTVAALARMAGLSRTNFLRTFRQATGQSPIGFLIGLRVESAKRLLRQSDRSMTAIAHDCGFGDSNYFARKFREATGRTPTEFRRRPLE